MNSIALLYALYLLCLPLFYNLSQSGKECKGVFSHYRYRFRMKYFRVFRVFRG